MNLKSAGLPHSAINCLSQVLSTAKTSRQHSTSSPAFTSQYYGFFLPFPDLAFF